MLEVEPPYFRVYKDGPRCSIIGLNGKEFISFSLNMLFVSSLKLLAKFTLKPDAVVMLMLVDPLITDETSALSKTPKSEAKSFIA